MREIRPTLFSLSVTLAVVAAAASLGAQTETLPRFDQQIVVTPARAESTIARVPAFVTLIDADDIAASPARDIPDLLRQAGVQVTDITGNGRSYRVDLRGFGATAGLNTLVLVDGRRVNQPDQSGSDWVADSARACRAHRSDSRRRRCSGLRRQRLWRRGQHRHEKRR